MQLDGTIHILLFIISIYATTRLFYKARQSTDLIYWVYGIAALSLAITFLLEPVSIFFRRVTPPFPLTTLSMWGDVITISIVMCGLLILIRNSKPGFARFPKPFVVLPILLIAAYPFIEYTIILKEWLMAIYEGGSLLVALMMHITLRRKDKNNDTILIGLGILLIVYIIYWYLSGSVQQYIWIRQILFAIAILFIVSGYLKIETTEQKIALDHI